MQVGYIGYVLICRHRYKTAVLRNSYNGQLTENRTIFRGLPNGTVSNEHEWPLKWPIPEALQ